jgi:hypothetical protein
MDQQTIRALCAADMTAVNELILTRLQSDVSLINKLGFYIVSAGGKRMRPMLTVMAARALGYEGEDHLKLAAIIEFIHTSTLLHDDVVDESDLRRGRETANALFGNAASVLVGDYLYSRSFQMMSELSNLKVMEILSDATNTIAEGEVLQLMNCNDPDTTEESYMTVIYCKTAKLFEAATRLAAQKPLTCSPPSSPEASQNTRPLTTSKNSPSVTRVTGSVSTTSTGRSTALSKPNISAAHSAELRLCTCTPLKKLATRSKAPALKNHCKNNRAITAPYEVEEWAAGAAFLPPSSQAARKIIISPRWV